MSELGEALMAVVGFVALLAAARFGWELAGAVGKRMALQLFPDQKLRFKTGADGDGRGYRWLNDGYGRVMYIERDARYDRDPEADT